MSFSSPFCASAVLLISLLLLPRAGQAEIEIEPRGKFIDSCTLPGEGKENWLHPSHPYCAQLSKDRFLWVYQTRGFLGIDSEHSIIYQLRSDQPDGPVLKEGFFSRYREDWDAKGDGKLFIKSHGHPKVIGVPKGATNENGTLFPAGNVFLATWYIIPALRDPDTCVVDRVGNNDLEAIHFRLADDGRDIEFLDEKPVRFREKGFEKGRAVCSIEPPQTAVNQWLRPPVIWGTMKRNPLFCWDIDPDNGFAASNKRVILDMKERIRFPMVGFAKLSPVVHNRQILTIRVSSMSQRKATEKYPALTKEELDNCGAYHSVITYDPPVPDTWKFAE